MLILINLESAVERRRLMARQLQGLGLPYERVGVDLRLVRKEHVDAEIAARGVGLRFDRKALSNPEIGCWLSHLTAWQRLLHSNEATAVVIEDDLILLPDFAQAIKALAQRPAFDVVYLGTSSRNVSQRRYTAIEGVRVHAPVGLILNTWGYSISRGYVERFLAGGRRSIDMPIDHFLGGRARRIKPQIGVLQPTVLREDPVLGRASQIGPYTRRIDRSRIVEKLRRRVLASPVSELYYSLYRYL